MTSSGMLEVSIPGTPQQQGSKRNVGRFSIEANKNLAPWRAEAIHATQAAMAEQGVAKFVDSVQVEATFTYQRPAAHYGTGRNRDRLKDSAPTYKASAPDLDKLQRAVGDALTQAGAIRDDALIVEWSTVKVWGETPGVDLVILSTSTT